MTSPKTPSKEAPIILTKLEELVPYSAHLSLLMNELDKANRELEELKEKLLLTSIGTSHFKSERDIHIKESEQFVTDSVKRITELEAENQALKAKLKWLVQHAIDSACISKAKGAELLGVPLIDMDEELSKIEVIT